MLDVKQIKKDFPIFRNNPGLVYLDSTATSLKPQIVIDKINEYYTQYTANIHRGIYKISEKATEEFEQTRQVVAEFINAPSQEEIIFTRSTTEAINLIVYSLGQSVIKKGDEIVTTVMEHHSNFVPWQQLAQRVEASFKIVDITDEGYLRNVESVVTKKTKILSLTYISNVLGTVNPIKEIIRKVRKLNPHIYIIVDAAQASPHHKIDVQDLNCDFLAFSSHKMLGPTGVGVLWGRRVVLEKMNPFNFGGDMVEEVYVDRTTFRAIPSKFEAGTPHIAGVIALKAAIEYLNTIGLDTISKHEEKLVSYAIERAQREFGDEIRIVGPSKRVGIMAFVINGIHPHDVAHILDEENIAIRVGFHCAMPLHTRLGLHATNRASFYLYNTQEDVDALIKGLKRVKKILA